MFSAAAYAQRTCVKLDNYQFFVPDEIGEPGWTEETLTTLIEREDGKDPTSWMVPVIVRELTEYAPACGARPVDKKFDLLIKLFSAIRRDKRLTSNVITVAKQVRLIRDDFQRQINNDRLFPYLILTFDDGPFSGEIVRAGSERGGISKDVAASFGKLRFSNANDRVIVTAFDKRRKPIWSRILNRTNPDRYLRAARLDMLTVQRTKFVVVATTSVDGERLNVYVRPNGRFMYYTHSW